MGNEKEGEESRSRLGVLSQKHLLPQRKFFFFLIGGSGHGLGLFLKSFPGGLNVQPE